MWNLLVFALIGVFVGAAARLLYPGRQPMHILGTLALGMLGALAGGLFSWLNWPAVEGQVHFGNLLMSMAGAMIVIALWAGVAYGRRFSEHR